MTIRALALCAILGLGLILHRFTRPAPTEDSGANTGSKPAPAWQTVDSVIPETSSAAPSPEEASSAATELPADPEELLRTAALSPEKQKAVWDSEHAAFLIETYFGKPLIAGLRQHDIAPLDSALAPSFSGAIFTIPPEPARSIGSFREKRIPSGSVPTPIVGVGLSRHLRDVAGLFKTIDYGHLRVLKLKDLEDRRRWSARFWLRLHGVNSSGAAREHVSEHNVEIAATSFETLKTELQNGSVITSWTEVSRIERESPTTAMREITESVGLNEVPLIDNWNVPDAVVRQYRFQLAAEDFDLDGRLDIAIATEEGAPMLLRAQEDARYVNVAANVGFIPWQNHYFHANSLVAWIDFDNDAFPDLIMGDHLYRNENGRRFTRLPESSGFKLRHEPMGAAVFDYDCDGLLDIYIAYQRPPIDQLKKQTKPWVGDSQSGGANVLWRNLGGGRFEDVTTRANAGGGLRKTFAVAVFFADDDHFPDLYLANDFGQNVLLRNRGDGSFEDITLSVKAGDFATSMGVAAGDLDNDGNAEVYVANMFSKMGRRIIGQVSAGDYPAGIYEQVLGSCAGNRLYQWNAQQGRYRELGEDLAVNGVGWAYAPAMTDLNGDGWLDLYATTGFVSRNRQKPDG